MNDYSASDAQNVAISSDTRASRNCTSIDNEVKKFLWVVYILQLVGFILPIAWLVGWVLCYVKRSSLGYKSHFRWQMRTFGFGLLWLVLSGVFAFVLIGPIIHTVASIWIIYRSAYGMIKLSEDRQLEG